MLLPIALVAAMGTGSVMAQEQDDEGAGGSDTGSVQGPVGDDPVGTDDGGLVDPDYGAGDEPTPDLPDGPVTGDTDGSDDDMVALPVDDCDDCDVMSLGMDELADTPARGGVIASTGESGGGGGGCSTDGFIPLPWRCGW